MIGRRGFITGLLSLPLLRKLPFATEAAPIAVEEVKWTGIVRTGLPTAAWRKLYNGSAGLTYLPEEFRELNDALSDSGREDIEEDDVERCPHCGERLDD